MNREVSTSLVEKYHRAVWALDHLGLPAKPARQILTQNYLALMLHYGQSGEGPDAEKALDDATGQVAAMCEQALRKEQDSNRLEWQKQRDFLVNAMRRVHYAMRANDIGMLHFFSPNNEIFSADVHPVHKVGYKLWQGVRTELKEAISHAMLRPRELHPAVLYVVEAMRRIIRALEFADVTGFAYYSPDASPLHLSAEQQGRQLWEGVTEEIGETVKVSDAQARAS